MILNEKMSQDNCEIVCAVVVEWLNPNGSVYRQVKHKVATSRLFRNHLREMFIEIQAAKGNATTKIKIKNICIFNKFVDEGKASIKFQDDKCTLFLSNAPSGPLKVFLEKIFIKMTASSEQSIKNPLKEVLSSNISMGGAQEVSPITTAEVNKANRRVTSAMSPATIRKRKLTDDISTKSILSKRFHSNEETEKLSEDQLKVLNAVLDGKNVFFTGSAGTGKSFLLKKIIAALPPDTTTATASTGVAACHIGGITLHQFAGISLGTATLERCYKLASRPGISSVWRKTKHLVIDEISMVVADFFDKLEAVARHVRKNDKPFGGIQLILCGDFFQLPPVSKGPNDKVKFCFESNLWDQCVQVNLELQTVYRQVDHEFVEILNSLRIGRVTDKITDKLKSTSKQKIEKNGVLATRLCTHVKEADETNSFKLNELNSDSKTYNAQDSDSTMSNMLEQQLPIPSQIVLKIGAQVMLLKNINVSEGLVNGARGVVIEFNNEMPVVQFRSGNRHTVTMEKWSIKTSSGGTMFRKQIPLKLAWAFSIHKSQGLTLDCVEMCLTRVFDAGQSYVALSRAQSLDSVRIIDFNADQVWANPTVLEFYKKFRRNIHSMEIIPLGKAKSTKSRVPTKKLPTLHVS